MLNDERRKTISKRTVIGQKADLVFFCWRSWRTILLVCSSVTLRLDDLNGSFWLVAKLRELFEDTGRESCKNAIRSLSASVRSTT